VTQIWHGKKAWGYSIRTERFRYTEWLEGKAGRELYDHRSDPDEITNLADDASQAEQVATLSTSLRAYVKLPEAKR
jgi:arylsulfatase A-like enzyme